MRPDFMCLLFCADASFEKLFAVSTRWTASSSPVPAWYTLAVLRHYYLVRSLCSVARADVNRSLDNQDAIHIALYILNIWKIYTTLCEPDAYYIHACKSVPHVSQSQSKQLINRKMYKPWAQNTDEWSHLEVWNTKLWWLMTGHTHPNVVTCVIWKAPAPLF